MAVLVHLFLDRLTICTQIGFGKTLIEAEEAAADGALVFLTKIMNNSN